MTIRNLHQRGFPCPSEQVAALLPGLGSPQDRLWPDGWPRLRFPQGLAPGSEGGHGPVRYRVVRLEKNLVVCEFIPRGLLAAFRGGHRFEVQGSALRHVLEARCGWLAWLLWLVVIRPLHNALLEDLLDRAELALTGKAPPPRRWSLWVRFLRPLVR